MATIGEKVNSSDNPELEGVLLKEDAYSVNRELLKIFLRKRNLTIHTLAPILGISKASVFTKLSGATQFKPSEIEKVANILGLSVQDIMYIFFPRFLGVPHDLDPVRYFSIISKQHE